MSKTVMALSGGMDSTTMLASLIAKGHKVECLFFTYGSKHNRYETTAAQKVAEYYGVPCHGAIDLAPVMKTFKSDLLLSGGDIPEGHYSDKSMERTVVPGRNMIFLSILAGHAWSIGAENIAIGIHQGDHAIYADCRKEFYKAMDSAIYLGTDRRVQIIAPFINIDKSDILEIGLTLKVPYELTRTCYKDQPHACGKCGSCVERLEAFMNNAAIDPVQYEGGK
jgi:7-cyano-7-deazaguanine synthase